MPLTALSPDCASALLIEQYDQARASSGAVRAMRNLRRELAARPPALWHSCAQTLRLRGDFDAVVALLDSPQANIAAAPELRYELGENLRLAGDQERAQQLLEPLAVAGDEAASESWAAILQAQGRLTAAAAAMAALLDRPGPDRETVRSRIVFVDQCQRPALAYALCQRAIVKFPAYGALLELAGRIALGLGRFAEGREHYLAALRDASDANVAACLHALSAAQRYEQAEHPDLEQFEHFLAAPNRSSNERVSVLFALGKARDDLGDSAAAATAFREGNRLYRQSLSWLREDWNRTLAGLMSAPRPAPVEEIQDFTPVFIVGLPRSGTTLAADRLARHPRVRNRGELNLIPYMQKWIDQSGPQPAPELLQKMATFAAAHLRQDDASAQGPVRWVVDKNPLNFRFLGLISTLLPNARIVYCKRDLRDTALSIWQQFFARGNDNGYAYAFDDIAAFAQGCERLMEHWRRTLGLPIHVLQYEHLVQHPQQTLHELNAFLAIPDADPARVNEAAKETFISSSSAWQARQPIYHRSIGRWTAYVDQLPELLAAFPEGASAG